MKNWNDWTQEEYILIFNTPCVIEPDHGWALVGFSRLLYYSLGISRTWFLPKPSIFKLFFKTSVQQIPKAISLRDTGEENYFHFYNDVLSKIYFLKSHGIDTNLPVIISERLWRLPYFQFYIENSPEIKALTWIIQRDQFIQCDSVIFCKPLTHKQNLFDRIFSPLRQKASSHNRIFLTRSTSRSRHLLNALEVEQVFKQNGFQIIDPDSLSVSEQIRIFTNGSLIAGIHGAGLTNIIFRKEPCRVLEIFPYPSEGYLPFHYIMIAKMMEHRYSAMIGEKKSFSDGIWLNIQKLEAKIKWLIQQ